MDQHFWLQLYKNMFLYINFFHSVFLLETFKKCQVSAGTGMRRELFMLWISTIHLFKHNKFQTSFVIHRFWPKWWKPPWNAFLFSSMSFSKCGTKLLLQWCFTWQLYLQCNSELIAIAIAFLVNIMLTIIIRSLKSFSLFFREQIDCIFVYICLNMHISE